VRSHTPHLRTLPSVRRWRPVAAVAVLCLVLSGAPADAGPVRPARDPRPVSEVRPPAGSGNGAIAERTGRPPAAVITDGRPPDLYRDNGLDCTVPTFASSRFAGFDAQVNDMLDDWNIGSAMLAVSNECATIYEKGYGLTGPWRRRRFLDPLRPTQGGGLPDRTDLRLGQRGHATVRLGLGGQPAADQLDHPHPDDPRALPAAGRRVGRRSRRGRSRCPWPVPPGSPTAHSGPVPRHAPAAPGRRPAPRTPYRRRVPRSADSRAVPTSCAPS
jgi:hypothetical protein